MSTEKIINIDETLNTTKVDVQKSSGRVDINNLITKVRKKESAENKIHLYFLSIFTFIVLITGYLLFFYKIYFN
jgi:hypothetical protein